MSGTASSSRQLPDALDRLRRLVVKPRKGQTFLERYAPAAGSPPPAFDPGCALAGLFAAHDGRVVHKWHHYLAIYERLIGPYRAGFVDASGNRRALRFLEIGVSKGGSLQLWRKYLGPDAVIFGVDVDPACAGVADADVVVRIGSQGDADFLKKVVAEMGGVDIVLDDGSHIGEHQRISFLTLLPLLSEGGLYLIEDLHTSYWPEWKGGHRRAGTGIEICKALVDDMHAWYHDAGCFYPAAAREIAEVAFFDSITAIRKESRLPPAQVYGGSAK